MSAVEESQTASDDSLALGRQSDALEASCRAAVAWRPVFASAPVDRTSDTLAGAVLESNHRRDRGRRVYIESVEGDYAYGRSRRPDGRRVRIHKSRIHADGKTRRSGYNVVR